MTTHLRNLRGLLRFLRVPSGTGCAARVTAIALAALPASCADTYETVSLENPLAADLADDTAPADRPYDPSLDYTGRYGITENHSSKRFRFDVMPYVDDAQKALAEVLFPSHAAFLSGHDQKGEHSLPSVQTIGTYVKQLDDTLYAGVERLVQDGLAPTVEAKRTILQGALAYLAQNRSAGGDEAMAVIAAALELGGDTPTVPSDLSAAVGDVKRAFLATPDKSKPIGFYTWSVELTRIWQQDRLLQLPLPTPDAACALAAAIAADGARRTQYENLVALYGKLTNPVKVSLLDLLGEATTSACTNDLHAFLSPSRTPEVLLFEKLYPGGVPPDADLMGDLVAAIRNGSVDLAPKPADGWYEHQLYALQSLLVTDQSEERAKIGFTARYKKRLQEAFSTMLVQHRETHVKQADTAEGTARPVDETPDFRLEPLATVYVRHARSYVFLEQALDGLLGKTALDTAVAVDEKGATTETLRTRIGRARDLFYGVYLVSCEDIGLRPSLAAPGDPAAENWTKLESAAAEWLRGLSGDALLASDVRVMVPIAELGDNRYKYWAVIGVRATLAGYSYIEGADMSPPPAQKTAAVWLPTEQFLEVNSSNVPLTRDELRKLCDEKKTPDAIKAAIEAR